MANKFQSEVRYDLPAATPGTLVEAADTYKYVRKAITADDKVAIGDFCRAAAGKPGQVSGAYTTGAVIGVVLNDIMVTGSDVPSMTLPKGQDIRIVENGIVAVVAMNTNNVDDYVFINNANKALSFSSNPSATGVGDATGWRVVQSCKAGGIAFIKK